MKFKFLALLAACFAPATTLLAQPAIYFDTPTNGELTTSLVSISGSFQNFDPPPVVTVSIHEVDINGGSGRWWNGTNFEANPAVLTASVSGTNWATVPNLALPQLNSGQSYQLGVTAANETNNAAANITVQAPMLVLNWDPGQTPLGTAVLPNPNTNGGNYMFQVSPQSPAVGVWRTALNVEAGGAYVYMSQGWEPTTNSYNYASYRSGSNGFVLDASQFQPGQTWYILVNATTNSQWNLLTGDVFVYNLGVLAADNSSSTNAPIGAEGMIFFKTTIPTNTLAWQLWLNGPTDPVYVKKSLAPDPLSYDLNQSGQMLVVPPYLAGGTFNGYYFVSVPGNPGTPVNLGSRQQPILSLSFNGFTNVTVGATNFPYVTYQVSVPVQQIAWQLNLTPVMGTANIASRLAAVPNEFNNDAYSDTGGGVGNSISLVPAPASDGSGVPGLSAGTNYVTVYGPGVFSCGFTNGNPVITPVSYLFNVTNDSPNRVGWRYYVVSDINSQLGSLGWLLLLSNAPPGSEIAVRRNDVPGQWNYRNNPSDNSFNNRSAGYVDLSSLNGALQQPGHQADIWYIGVYSPGQALGNFTLTGSALAPQPLPFDGNGNSVRVNNEIPGFWQYFEVLVPADTNLLGWDLRLTDITAGNPQLYVCQDLLPSTYLDVYYWSSSWPSGSEAGGWYDWTGCGGYPLIEVGMGNPLQAGTYYVGVYDPNYTNSYTLVSQGIGLTNYSIPVIPLNLTGSVANPALPVGEAAYYQVVVTSNTPDWKLQLGMVTGDALLMVQQDYLPNNLGYANYDYVYGYNYWGDYGNVDPGWGGQRMMKAGDEQWALLPENGTNVTAGTYYVLVASQGQNLINGCEGTGAASYILNSWVDGVTTLAGTLSYESDLTVAGNQPGGALMFYQFTVPANVASIEVTLENATGNPCMTLNAGPVLVSPEYYYENDAYGNYGGMYAQWISGNLITIPNPQAGVYSLSVYGAEDGSGKYPDAAYTVRVHAVPPTLVAFDGAGNSSSVNNQAPGIWQFFQINVPADTNLLGWDLRLTNVVAGSPQLFVSAQSLPTAWTDIYYGSTAWSSNDVAAGWYDWTGCGGDPVMEVGMGNPLEAGTYYIGVYDPSNTNSYTLVSRGIGLTNYSIPVTPLNLTGSVSNPALPVGEAAYYQVVVTSNTPDWKLHLGLTTGDALMMVQQSFLPNNLGDYYSWGNYGNVNPGSGGQRMMKAGDEQWALLPVNGTNVTVGTYYVLVASQGRNLTNGCEGTGSASYSLNSWVDGVTSLAGTLSYASDLTGTGSQQGGTVLFYQFTVPTNLASIEVTLENATGNPWMTLNTGTALVSPDYYYYDYYDNDNDTYGNYGGTYAHLVSGNLITIPNPQSGVYSLSVYGADDSSGNYPDAAYTVRVHAVPPPPPPLPTLVSFDGPGNSSSVSNQTPGIWKYFQINVPADTNLLGWDLRLTNVVAGSPQMYVSAQSLPTASVDIFYLSTSWPSNYVAGSWYDWTGCAGYPMMEVGMGNPLQAGTYYVGVYDPNFTNSYTLVSRGIGLTNYSIPVNALNMTGSVTNLALPVGEAAYYQVVVASNTPDWKLHLGMTGGDALIMVQQSYLPNNLGYPYDYYYWGEYGNVNPGQGGQRMMKAGDEQWALLPVNGTNVIAGTYYVLVASQGQNLTNGCEGMGGASYTLNSWVDGVSSLAGTLSYGSDLTRTGSQPGGTVMFYQFSVPTNTDCVQVTLENTVGNPQMMLNTGTSLVKGDDYGEYGGTYAQWSSGSLITIPNSQAGVYSLSIYAGIDNSDNYPDASYTVDVDVPLVPQLSFCPQLNSVTLTNVATGTLADTMSQYYEVTVPANVDGAPVLGWQISLSQSSGSASIKVRPNLLPEDTCDTTSFTSGSIIIAPPYLTPGIWYVQVQASGSTTFSLSSSVITTNTLTRNLWVMPTIGEADTSPGLALPEFGDTGVNTNGAPLAGDQGVDLAQGQYDFYAIMVPTNNAGLLRTELQAISGNPNLYIRAGAVPTFNHYSSGSCGSSSLIDRQLTGSTTEYGNWVPLSGRTATNLTPGLWILSVYASGDANTRYRLQLSCGSSATNGLVQDLPLDGSITYTNQQLAGGDWRYYRVQIPTNAPNNWVVNWTCSEGAAHLFIRDTVPPGDATYGSSSANYNSEPNTAVTWATDWKNEGPYPNFALPGINVLSTPPLRPGDFYYLGFWSPDDAIFSVTCGTNGGAIDVTNILNGYGAFIASPIPAHGTLLYRMDVPLNATRLLFNATNSTDLEFTLEQGTVALAGGPAQWNGNQADISFNEVLGAQNYWPWLPGYSYYLTITNTSSASENFSVTMGTPADLSPMIVSVPANVTANQPNPQVQVVWGVTNNGPAAASGGWTDTVWFSTNGVLDGNSINVGNFWVGQTVPPGRAYWQTNQVTLPMSGSGGYTIFVQVDVYNSLYEAVLNDKISTGATGTFTLIPPDLAPISIASASNSVTFYPTSPQSPTVPVVYAVTNQGAGAASGYWYDMVSVSTNATTNGIISSQTYSQSRITPGLPPGGVYQVTNTVTLPQQSGTYWLILQVNAYNNLCEAATTNNTLVAAMPVTVTYQVVPPDLAPVCIAPVSNSVAFYPVSPQSPKVPVMYAVTNQGAGAASGYWYDMVSVSTNATTNGIISSQTFSESWSLPGLPPGGVYQTTNSVALPQQSGTYWLILQVNAYNYLYEAVASNNTLVTSVPVTVTYQVNPPDLEPLSVIAVSNNLVIYTVSPQSPTVPVVSVVTNLGPGAAASTWGFWYDTVYVSTNSSLSGTVSSQYLTEDYSTSAPLAAGGVYAQTNLIALPQQSGAYYLIYMANAYLVNGYGYYDVYESDTTNNLLVSAPMTLAYNVVSPGYLQVTLNPPAVVAAGAMWQAGGSPWESGGATANVVPGTNTIQFSPVVGWNTPANQTVIITNGLLTSATGNYTENYFYYTTSPDAVTITGYFGPGGAVVIPNAINGLPVAAIGNGAFYGSAILTNVLIPGSVTNIGEQAFADCSNLLGITVDPSNPAYSSLDGVLFNQNQTTLNQYPGGLGGAYTIPGGVTTIGGMAFSYSRATNVTFSTNVTSIGDYAFYDCPELAAVTIPGSVTNIGDMAFGYCNGLTNVCLLYGVPAISDDAFYGCSSLISITLSGSLAGIGDYAFYGCTNLINLTIPGSVASIGQYAFYDCSHLTSFTIPNGVGAIEDETFGDCAGLTSVSIGNSVTNISLNAFSDCFSLESFTVSANNPVFSGLAGVLFDKTQTLLIEYPAGKNGGYIVPNTVTCIGSNAFSDCPGLASVTISGSVINLGDSAFSECHNLTNVIILDGITNISDYCFEDCFKLTSVTIPLSVANIGDYAFYGCNGLTTFTVPGNVAVLGLMAFGYCNDLTNVTLLNGITNIGEDAFYGCPGLTSVTLPGSIVDIAESAFGGCNNLTNLTFLNGVTAISDDSFYGCSSLISVTLPSSLTSIGDYAFYACTHLTGVTIPGNVTNIGVEAFGYCSSLAQIALTNSITSIGEGAFARSGLTYITIPESLSNIGDSVFDGCIHLSGVNLPDSINSIDYYAFYDCPSLSSLAIPNSVTNIGYQAFSEDGLAYVCFEGDAPTDDGYIFYGNTGLNVINYVSGTTGWTTNFDGINTAPCTQCAIGALQVTITPAAAVSAGAEWQVDGGAWLGCGETTSVSPGIHMVQFSSVPGWNTPTSQLVSITNGTLTAIAVTYTPNYYYYTINSSAITITGYFGPGGAVSIPNAINGLPVTSIGYEAIMYNTNITSVAIPASVTSIGNWAFYDCSVLTSVTIGNGVTNIGEYAFYYDASLASVTIGNGLTTIESDAFTYDYRLNTVCFAGNEPTNVGSSVFYDDNLSVINYAAGTTGWGATFDGIATESCAECAFGTLQVVLAPSAAVSDGAEWQVDGGSWEAGGAITPLSAGTHIIKFGNVLGWNTPSNQVVTITNGLLTTISGTYTQSPGALQVTITPPAAVAAGAQWTLDGTNWQVGGSTLTNFAPGIYSVSFSPLDGWITPVREWVAVNQSETTTATGNYLPAGYLQVVIQPNPAVLAGEQWAVDGGPWLASGTMVTNSTGSHVVSFLPVSWWTPLGNLAAMVSAGVTNQLVVTLSQLATTVVNGATVTNAASQLLYDFTTLAGSPLVAGSINGTNHQALFDYPTAVKPDQNGNLYVIDAGNAALRKITPSGTNWVATSLFGQFNFPVDLAVGGNGVVYVADNGNSTVWQLLPSGTNWVAATIAGLAGNFGDADGTNNAATFYSLGGIAADGGNLYVTDGNAVRKLSPVGTNWVVTTIAGSVLNSGSADGSNSAARFAWPNALASDSGGNLYVADSGNGTIRKLTARGTNWVVSTIAGTAGVNGAGDGADNGAAFDSPVGVGLDASGDIFVADTWNETIRELTASGTNWVESTIGGLAGHAGSSDGFGGLAQFNGPQGLVVDSAGNVYVADTENNTIRRGAPAIIPTVQVLSTIRGSVSLASAAVAGSRYQVQYTTSLSSPNWINLGGPVTATNSVLTILDNPGTAAARFYRLILLP